MSELPVAALFHKMHIHALRKSPSLPHKLTKYPAVIPSASSLCYNLLSTRHIEGQVME